MTSCPSRQFSKVLFWVRIEDAIFLTCFHLEVLSFSFRQTLQNCVRSNDVVSSRSNSPDSTSATRSINDIAEVLDVLAFLGKEVARRCEELGGDRRSITITRRPLHCRSRFFFYLYILSSLLTVSGLLLLSLFP